MTIEEVQLVKVDQSGKVKGKAVILENRDLNPLHFVDQNRLARFVLKFLNAHRWVTKVFSIYKTLNEFLKLEILPNIILKHVLIIIFLNHSLH